MNMAKYDLARTILGKDFITPGEVARARPSILYTDNKTHKLSESLPPLAVLEWCKDNGYAVMPAPPTAMSMLDLWEMEPLHFCSKTGEWYADPEFSHENKTSPGWIAIKKTPIEDSTNKNWDEQNKFLSSVERVPNVAEMSWFITTYFKVRNERLFENAYVRTSSLGPDGYRVDVGYFDARGLNIASDWVVSRIIVSLGVSAGRKF